MKIQVSPRKKNEAHTNPEQEVGFIVCGEVSENHVRTRVGYSGHTFLYPGNVYWNGLKQQPWPYRERPQT